MKKKTTERHFKSMMNYYSLFSHKWRDRGYPSCPRCHKQIKQCPYCKGDTLLPKASTYPDYLVTRFYAFVEVKSGTDTYNLYDLSVNQEKVLKENEEKAHSTGWVYIEFTKVRLAFLVEWENYKKIRSDVGELGFKSVRGIDTERGRAPLAEDVFRSWKLEWEDGGWKIPKLHMWNYHKL